jgi:hypothetical protein
LIELERVANNKEANEPIISRVKWACDSSQDFLDRAREGC